MRVSVFIAAVALVLTSCGPSDTEPETTTVEITTTSETTTTPDSTVTSSPSQPPSTLPSDTVTVPSECPPIGPDRIESVVGPVFVCERIVGGNLIYGGQPVSRPGVDTAEEAIISWLDGPDEQEQAAGLQGWDLRPYSWFADSLTLRREGITLIMGLSRWEPINNLSTSTGSAVFYISLFATAFSDPTVEQFELSIMGESCPVYIGEGEWCFPIDWDDLVAATG